VDAYKTILNLWTKGDFDTLSKLVDTQFLSSLQKASSEFKQDGISFSTSLETIHEANLEGIRMILLNENGAMQLVFEIDVHIYATKLDYSIEKKLKRRIYTTESELLTFRGKLPDIKWTLVNLQTL